MSWWVWLLLIAWGPSVALALLLLVVLSPVIVGMRVRDHAIITRRAAVSQGEESARELSSG
jgi:hypothetical protein